MSRKEILLLFKKRLYNWLRSLFYLLLLYYLLVEVAITIFGKDAKDWIVFWVVLGIFFFNRLSVSYIMRLYGAKKIEYWEAPFLYRQTGILTQKAALDNKITLYHLPMRELNALTLEGGGEIGIALTDGILKHLNEEEITAVLAHEVSHIKNKDLFFMNLATHFSRLTYLLSSIAQFFLLLYFPLFLILGIRLSLFRLFLLLFAPWISILLQSALSRTREFEADLTAVELIGDSTPLITALEKIEYYNSSFWQGLLQALKIPDFSFLNTHPPTRERIKEIEAFQKKNIYYFPS